MDDKQRPRRPAWVLWLFLFAAVMGVAAAYITYLVVGGDRDKSAVPVEQPADTSLAK